MVQVKHNDCTIMFSMTTNRTKRTGPDLWISMVLDLADTLVWSYMAWGHPRKCYGASLHTNNEWIIVVENNNNTI